MPTGLNTKIRPTQLYLLKVDVTYIPTILNNLHMNGNRCENLHIGLRVRFSGFLGQGSLLDLLTVLIS